MNVTIIYGNQRKGSTYNIAQLFLKKLMSANDNLTEFFLPEAMPSFCFGCCNCFAKGEEYCPHYDYVEPIRSAMEKSDVIVFTTPVYVLRTSGQMKTLLDHFAFQFMTHRPNPAMFSKTAVIFSTGAGGGTKSAMKDIAVSLKFWGVAKIYKAGFAVFNSEWENVSDKIKGKITVKVNSLADSIGNKPKVNISTKMLFRMFRLFHKKFRFCEYDYLYWERNGWIKGDRPWQRK
jgi:Multimeric flavodoxin WrbA